MGGSLEKVSDPRNKQQETSVTQQQSTPLTCIQATSKQKKRLNIRSAIKKLPFLLFKLKLSYITL